MKHLFAFGIEDLLKCSPVFMNQTICIPTKSGCKTTFFVRTLTPPVLNMRCHWVLSVFRLAARENNQLTRLEFTEIVGAVAVIETVWGLEINRFFPEIDLCADIPKYMEKQ